MTRTRRIPSRTDALLEQLISLETRRLQFEHDQARRLREIVDRLELLDRRIGANYLAEKARREAAA